MESRAPWRALMPAAVRGRRARAHARAPGSVNAASR
jgi:hypothetical protein